MNWASDQGEDARLGGGQGGEREQSAQEGPERDLKNSEAEDDKGDTSYDVGYGRPPKHSRVMKGQVLNPKGRPKGSKNRVHTPSQQDLYGIILEEARRMITVADVSGAVSMPMAQAIIRSTLVVAAKGNTRAQRLAADLIRIAELETKRERDHEIEVALDYKIAWTRTLADRKATGRKGPAPLPHPDHVVIDLARGQVHVKGPATKEEKIAWARWEQYRAELEADLRDLEADHHDPNCVVDEALAKEIQDLRDVLRIIGYALDGNRDAMGLLEDVFTDLVRAYPEEYRD